MNSPIDIIRLEKLLSDLISIYSPYLNEEEAMKFVFDWFKERDIPTELHTYTEDKILKYNGINVIGSLKGNRKGPVILLNGHVDSVEKTSGWTKNPLIPVIEGDKMYGLGSLDMKAGVAAIMVAVEAFHKNHKDFSGEIIYTLVSDEEGPYGLGTDAVIMDGIADHADLAIVTEPSSGFTDIQFPALCLGARGGYNYTVYLKGIASHAANPEKGLNAISEASKLILELEKTQTKSDEKLGKGDMCVIRMEGGGAACSVAELASFTVFRHVVRGETKEYLMQEVEEAARRAGIKAEMKVVFRDSSHSLNDGFMPYVVEQDSEYYMSLMETIEEVTGKKPEISYFSSIGDFNYLGTRLKIPTFVFGPSGENYHAADEYVNMPSVVQTAEVIYSFLVKQLV
jgi:succinyl-diaminopimelate desuccinylase